MIYSEPSLGAEEAAIVADIERLREQLRYATHQAKQWTGVLRRTAFARAVQGSNTIEGINVSLEDALAVVAGDAPYDAERSTREAIQNYRDAMTYALQAARDPSFSFSADVIKAIHFLVIRHDLTKNPGRWRPGPIYVRSSRSGEIVYDGPPASDLPGLVAELVAYLNTPRPGASLLRGAMAHLNLALIHPFSDGNGRAARVLQSLVLTREGILEPEFCSIEEYLGRNTPSYYEVLARVAQGAWTPERDATPWVHFCLTAHYHQANRLLRRTREFERLWDALSHLARRHGLHPRTVFALFDAATGLRVRNPIYRLSADISDHVAGRDLKQLADAGLLVAQGEKRGRTYIAGSELLAVRSATREPRQAELPSLFAQRRLPL